MNSGLTDLFRVAVCIFAVIMALSVTSCSDTEFENLEKVEKSRFMGTWYEVAALPTTFNKGCSCSKIDLQSDKEDDYVKMIYSCIKKEKQGAVLAKIFTSDNGDFSKWRLQYFWPFRNTLYVVEVDSSYNYAMIAGPDRDFLQILSREKSPDTSIIDKMVAKADGLGFATQALVYPDQNCD